LAQVIAVSPNSSNAPSTQEVVTFFDTNTLRRESFTVPTVGIFIDREVPTLHVTVPGQFVSFGDQVIPRDFQAGSVDIQIVPTTLDGPPLGGPPEGGNISFGGRPPSTTPPSPPPPVQTDVPPTTAPPATPPPPTPPPTNTPPQSNNNNAFIANVIFTIPNPDPGIPPAPVPPAPSPFVPPPDVRQTINDKLFTAAPGGVSTVLPDLATLPSLGQLTFSPETDLFERLSYVPTSLRLGDYPRGEDLAIRPIVHQAPEGHDEVPLEIVLPGRKVSLLANATLDGDENMKLIGSFLKEAYPHQPEAVKKTAPRAVVPVGGSENQEVPIAEVGNEVHVSAPASHRVAWLQWTVAGGFAATVAGVLVMRYRWRLMKAKQHPPTA
jgi:hypothetical protein